MKIFDLSIGTKQVWFRLFGFGLSLLYSKQRLFSERSGMRKLIRFGNFKIEFLTK